MFTRHRSRAGLPAALTVVALLALGACGDDDDDSSGSSGNGDKPTYTIGFQGALSGDAAQLGINMDNGAQLAIEQANAKGDLPFRIAYVKSDDKGSQSEGPAAAQALIDNDKVVAVIGPAFSGPTRSAGRAYADAKLLALSASASAPDLTKLGFSTFFRLVAPDLLQGQEVARYLATVVKAKKVYSVDDKSEYGVGLSGILEPALRKLGVAVTHEGIAPTKDYSAIAQKIARTNPDAVYYSGYYGEFALLSRAVRSAGYRGQLMSGDGGKDRQYVTQAGNAAAEGTLFSCACLDPAASTEPEAQEFVKAYEAKFRTPPGTYSAEAYDAANLIIGAIKTLGDDVTREKIVEYIRTVDVDALTKHVAFEPNGEVKGGSIFIYQVKDGKITVLGQTSTLIP